MAKFEWAVVRCMDGRLNKPIRDFLEEKGIPEEHDLVSIPGGPKDLLDQEQGLFRALEEVSIVLHRVEKVALIQHTDCGKYGGRSECGGTEEADLEFHRSQLRQAAEVFEKAHPEMELLLVIAHIRDAGEVDFIELV